MRLSVVGLISVIAAAEQLSGVYASNEGFETEALCGEVSAACAAPGEILDVSSATDDVSIGHTKGKRAGGKREKRRRRVGFSHEDVAGDESLQPFLQAFRDSLSGSEKATGFDEEQDFPGLLPAKDTSISPAEEGDEVTLQRVDSAKPIQYLAMRAAFEYKDVICTLFTSYITCTYVEAIIDLHAQSGARHPLMCLWRKGYSTYLNATMLLLHDAVTTFA